MRKLLLLLLLSTGLTCFAQVKNYDLKKILSSKRLSSSEKETAVSYQVAKGFKLNKDCKLSDDIIVIKNQEDFDKLFTKKKKVVPIDFNLNYVVVASAKTEAKCKKLSVIDVVCNERGELIIYTYGVCDEPRTEITRLRVNPDGSKNIVRSLEGKPYPKEKMKPKYQLIIIPNEYQGDVKQSSMFKVRTSSAWAGNKAERKEMKKLIEEEKVVKE